MRTRQWVAGGLAAGALFLAGGGTAFAGEVTGPPGADGFATGKPTPIASYVMHSICAFSGLNAYHPGKEGEYPGHTQNYGQIVKIGGKAMVDAETGGPGVACNGHTGELTQPPPQP
jgi:hypothetical protein